MATPRFVPVGPRERARPIDFAGIPPARRTQPRAGVVGRAPVIYDVLFASALLAYDDPDALECAVLRARLLSGVAHDPDLRQWLSDAVNSAAEVSVRSTAEAIDTWRCTILADPRSRRT